MINVSTFLFPTYGSHYNPLVGAGILMAAVVVIAFFWKRPIIQLGPGGRPLRPSCKMGR